MKANTIKFVLCLPTTAGHETHPEVQLIYSVNLIGEKWFFFLVGINCRELHVHFPFSVLWPHLVTSLQVHMYSNTVVSGRHISLESSANSDSNNLSGISFPQIPNLWGQGWGKLMKIFHLGHSALKSFILHIVQLCLCVNSNIMYKEASLM